MGLQPDGLGVNRVFGTTEQQTVHTEALGTVADHIVSTTSGLQAAFNNLTAGDTVWIETPETPYQTDQWLDIDVSGVTIAAETPLAADGTPLIKVADNANIGGIRVGMSNAVEDVTIAGIGYNGNGVELDANGVPVTDGSGNYTYNQDQSVLHLHGITVFANAENVRIRDCFLTNCSPFEEHDDGGTPITVHSGAKWVAVDNNRITYGGDRNIQSAGEYVAITRNRMDNKYDRAISLDVLQQTDTQWHYGERTVVSNNIVDDTDGSIDGSCIGVRGRVATTRSGAEGVASGEALRDVSIAGNATNGGRIGVLCSHLDPSAGDGNVAISNNVANDPEDYGVWVLSQGDATISVNNNTIKNGASIGGILVNASNTSVMGNSVLNPSGYGIEVSGGSTVGGNSIYKPTGNGVILSGANSTATNNQIRDASIGIRSEGANCKIGDNSVLFANSDGISAEGAESIVSGNLARQSSGENIVLKNSASDCLVASNLGIGSAISEDGVDDNIFIGNVVKGGGQVYHKGTSTIAMWNSPQRDVDLSGRTPPDGTIMSDDGTNGPSGALYERNGGSWHGIGAASGTTI